MSAEPTTLLKAPFPWFGGKSRVAAEIWRRFGDVPSYVEPFFGSGAVLLARPHPPKTETVNDADGLLANFWRALQHDPDGVAYHAGYPVSEIDLHARHLWLLDQQADVEAMLADPEAYDAKVAGWWVWGQSLWIGSGWCSGEGPWRLVGGRMVKGGDGEGVERARPHLGTAGKGVARQAPRLTGQQGVQRSDLPGVARKVPYLSGDGMGVHRRIPGDTRNPPNLANAGKGVARPELAGDARQLPYLSRGGRGVGRKLPYVSHGSRGVASAPNNGALYAYLRDLAARLRRVRVVCGDWARVVTPAVTVENGLTAVLLDPPYSGSERKGGLYARDSGELAADARRWAIEHGDDPRLRICLAGYAGEHEMPPSWAMYRWKAAGGYGSQGEGRGRENAARETLWFSPHCLPAVRAQRSLFDAGTEATP